MGKCIRRSCRLQICASSLDDGQDHNDDNAAEAAAARDIVVATGGRSTQISDGRVDKDNRNYATLKCELVE